MYQSHEKVRATIYLPKELLSEARDAAVYLAGYPARLTLTQLAENAFRAELRRLKLLYNNGLDFPPARGRTPRRTSHCGLTRPRTARPK